MAEADRIQILTTDGERVEVFVDEMPEDAEDLLFLLWEEKAPLDTWLEVAVVYYRQRRISQCRRVLERASSAEVDSQYSGPANKLTRIKILNALAALEMQDAQAAPQQQLAGPKVQERIVHFVSRAESLDQLTEQTWITKGVNHLVLRGSVNEAALEFDNALDSNSNNVQALLGKACVQYHQKDYKAACKTFTTAISLAPLASNAASMRVGLGLCWFKLGQLQLARKSFDRALQLAPDNAHALVSAGVLRLRPPEDKKASFLRKK